MELRSDGWHSDIECIIRASVIIHNICIDHRDDVDDDMIPGDQEDGGGHQVGGVGNGNEDNDANISIPRDVRDSVATYLYKLFEQQGDSWRMREGTFWGREFP